MTPDPKVPDLLGMADWIWEPDIGCHIPCCTRSLGHGQGRCGNGPLEVAGIELGDCGEHPTEATP